MTKNKGIDYELVCSILQDGIKGIKKDIEMQNDRIRTIETELYNTKNSFNSLKTDIIDECNDFALRKDMEVLKRIDALYKKKMFLSKKDKESIENKEETSKLF